MLPQTPARGIAAGRVPQTRQGKGVDNIFFLQPAFAGEARQLASDGRIAEALGLIQEALDRLMRGDKDVPDRIQVLATQVLPAYPAHRHARVIALAGSFFAAAMIFGWKVKPR